MLIVYIRNRIVIDYVKLRIVIDYNVKHRIVIDYVKHRIVIDNVKHQIVLVYVKHRIVLVYVKHQIDLSTARPKWRLDGPALSGRLLYSLVNQAYANRYHHHLVRKLVSNMIMERYGFQIYIIRIQSSNA